MEKCGAVRGARCVGETNSGTLWAGRWVCTRRPRDLRGALGQAARGGWGRSVQQGRVVLFRSWQHPLGGDLKAAGPQGWEAGKQALAGRQLGSH